MNIREFLQIFGIGGNPDTIKVLNLSNRELYRLPKSIVQLKSLEVLYLDGNPSLDWDATFKLLQELPNLQWLNLWKNKLTSLPPSIGELKNLKMLNLGDNKLKSLSPSISKLKNLKTLYLWSNRFSETEKEIISELLPECNVII